MKKILLIIAAALLSFLAIAQDVSFTATGPAKVGVGQNFQVQYKVNAKGSNIKLGDYSGLKFVNGPSTSSSTNTQIANGSVSTSVSYGYTYVFQAQNTGKFTISAASITVDGKQYSSNPVTIEVQKDPVQTQNNRRQNYYDPFADFYNQQQPQVNNTPKEITNEDLFIRVTPDKTTVYKGEPINIVVKLYTKVDLTGVDDIKFPSFDSFYVEELEAATRLNFSRETYNGVTYNVALIRRYLLYPRVTGNVTIEPCEVNCQVRQPVSGGNNVYAQFFSYYENVERRIKSSAINVTVKSLPAAPDAFTGAIGKFTVKMVQNEDTVNVNDAVSFKFTVSGTGNFNMIECPDIVWPKEFEVYEPVASQNLSSSTTGTSGSKTWEFTVIPRYPGKFKLGKLNFVYFDSASKQYKTLTTDEINLAVRKDANDTNFGETDYNYSQKTVEYIGNEDIRFAKKDNLNLVKNYKPLSSKGYVWIFYLLPLLIFTTIAVLLRKKIKEKADIAALKVKMAGKTSRIRLKKARKLMQQNNKAGFYKEIINALWGYASDRFAVPVSELSKDKIVQVFANSNIDSELSNKFIALIDKCEFAHFAPSSPEFGFETIYNEAVEIIEKLEQKI